MTEKIIIDATIPKETRVCVLDKNKKIKIFEFESQYKKSLKGNIYLGEITRVEPSLQAAFVNFGEEKSGFLPFSEIAETYYNIPVKDQNLTYIADQTILTQKNPNEENLSSKENTNEDLPGEDFDIEEDINLSKIESLVKNNQDPKIKIEEPDIDIERFTPKCKTFDKKNSYQIQDVIKKGNVVLVQILKDEKRNKGATVTTFISLAGKYCILLPNKGSHNGISKKIFSSKERDRIRNILNSLNSEKDKESASIIARTASMDKNYLDISKDYSYLIRLWNQIRDLTLKSNAPAFIHHEEDLLLRTVRDFFDKHISEIIIQGEEGHNKLKFLMEEILPDKSKFVKKYSKNTPIFIEYDIENQISLLYQSNVDLPSGGAIVIHPTEALISIDVNSGKFIHERNVEEMALKNNIEASKEIAKQTQLRNLSGLIVIDFIDMNLTYNRKLVERSLKEFFRYDKAKIQISKISEFGLLEMSRQRFRPSFLELNSDMCSYCNGKGLVRIGESNAMLILRTIKNEIFKEPSFSIKEINVLTHPTATLYILNNKREEIDFIEKEYKVKLNFHSDINSLNSFESFSIEKLKYMINENKSIPKKSDKKALNAEKEFQKLKPAELEKKESQPKKLDILKNTTRKKRIKQTDPNQEEKEVKRNFYKIKK